MSVKPELRDQLRTLSIPKEQRPAGRGGGAPPADGRPAARPRGLGFLAAVALVLVGVGGYAAWHNRAALLAAAGVDLPALGSQPAEVRLISVTSRESLPAGPVLTATGKIVSDHIVQVATKVSGQIVELHFEQGDAVEEGQMLARLEDVIYRALRDQAAARVKKSEAALQFHRFDFERITGLHKSGRSSDIELAEARRALDESAAQLAADRAALEYAEKQLRDTVVVAPIAGVVLTRDVEVGDFVAAEGGRGANANAQFATIADMTKLRVEVDISELDIVRIHRGMRCRVTPDAYKDRTYDGHVLWIDPGANYAKATVQAKVRIENPDDYLRVEGSAKVEFLPDAPPGGESVSQTGIWIPRAAVRLADPPTTGTVFIADSDRLRQRTVQLGRVENDRVQVLSGLADGDRIAADAGQESLRDGLRIQR